MRNVSVEVVGSTARIYWVDGSGSIRTSRVESGVGTGLVRIDGRRMFKYVDPKVNFGYKLASTEGLFELDLLGCHREETTCPWEMPSRLYLSSSRCLFIPLQNIAQYLGIAPGYAPTEMV